MKKPVLPYVVVVLSLVVSFCLMLYGFLYADTPASSCRDFSGGYSAGVGSLSFWYLLIEFIFAYLKKKKHVQPTE